MSDNRSTNASGVALATRDDLRRIAEIHAASWRDAYRGIVPDALIASRTGEIESVIAGWEATFSKYPANLTVCRREGEIVGFCCAGDVVDAERNGPFAFEVYGLHVEPSFRGNGVGAALLRSALAKARAEGKDAIVWTLEGLALSRRFYEREGGVPVKHALWHPDGHTIPEVAYGWTFGASTRTTPK